MNSTARPCSHSGRVFENCQSHGFVCIDNRNCPHGEGGYTELLLNREGERDRRRILASKGILPEGWTVPDAGVGE